MIAGGKYTTFRKMAEDLNKKTFKDMGISYNKKLSKSPFKTTSVIRNAIEDNITIDSLEKIIKNEKVRTLDDILKRRLSLTAESNLDSSEKEAIEEIRKKF